MHPILPLAETLHLPDKTFIMLAIVDGGSTKADWKILLDDGLVLDANTTGFNPNYDSQDRIANLVKTGLEGKLDPQKPGVIHYYGAGCWDTGRKAVVANAIAAVFPAAQVMVYHDLLAAARATCGDKPGVVCILGTGSNSVLYDGEKEIDNVTNLGFFLGDEGSGAQIGKKFVKTFFYREMPARLHPVMEKACPNGRKDILDKVYGGGVPAAYLATFARLFTEEQDDPWVRKIIWNCFDEFLRRHVCKYVNHQTLPVHFVGSVAFHFQEILKEAVEQLGLHLGQILKKPINNLFKYHLEKI